MHLEILLEEESMEIVVNSILERINPPQSEHTWKTHPHRGKQDMIRQLPKKLRAYANFLPAMYRNGDYRIIVIVDKDEQDCVPLKTKILNAAHEVGLHTKTIVRIAVCELESWYLGDAIALEKAFPRLSRQRIGRKATFRNPDARPDPTADLQRLLEAEKYGAYLKLAHSRLISGHLDLEPGVNRSHSFQLTTATFVDLLTSGT